MSNLVKPSVEGTAAAASARPGRRCHSLVGRGDRVRDFACLCPPVMLLPRVAAPDRSQGDFALFPAGEHWMIAGLS